MLYNEKMYTTATAEQSSTRLPNNHDKQQQQ